MLEKPDLEDEKIVECLLTEYGLNIDHVEFLPLGADVNTAVYRVTETGTSYFLKLRRGIFAETAVTLPGFLSDQGIAQIIPPLAARSGRLWGNLPPFKTILYPFIEGHNGYETTLSDAHWAALGAALKYIHTTAVPPGITSQIRRESYSATGRQFVRQFLAEVPAVAHAHPTAGQIAAFLQSKQAEILALIARAEQLAQVLQAGPQELVVCHSDLHAGNLFIDSNGALYIIDWDELILAPKERDLMYIGGGLLASGLTPPEEEIRFYPAYGQTKLNAAALAYYRYERIVQDIFEYCKRVSAPAGSGEDLAQSLYNLQSDFLPNHTIDIAYQTDRTRL